MVLSLFNGNKIDIPKKIVLVGSIKKHRRSNFFQMWQSNCTLTRFSDDLESFQGKSRVHNTGPFHHKKLVWTVKAIYLEIARGQLKYQWNIPRSLQFREESQ